MAGTGLYFEDYAVGDRFTSPGRTVTESDVVTFAGLSGDFNPLHVDAEAAAESPFGQRVAHGLLVMAIASGLSNQMGIFAGTSLGLLGFQDWRFKAPVLFGDTIHVEMEMRDLKRSRTGDRGVVTYLRQVINQKGEVTQEGTCVALVKAREGAHETTEANSGIQ
ncbi:MaoC/PaaZ C-terminal domain-containing protein [Pseudonocardia sp. H11422]|uniref:MaoC/PaaZ C-terminal domain-containing protein n=1 Tax=Pseudonocardia sp. H11422 TaxID=2835866 RepID=UPI001BDC8EE9|nr:MaoC/PaaZ C-terminal domain-containing protein [Pseudonocardia sp. H11422]